MCIRDRVILASIEASLTALPANSMVYPVPPEVPISPITARIISFEKMPSGSAPFRLIRMFFILRATRHCVARTCSTSEVPIPNASAPRAPCVAVCESPHTIVIPTMFFSSIMSSALIRRIIWFIVSIKHLV